jgi:hypothetical protein
MQTGEALITGTPGALRRWIASASVAASFCLVAWLVLGGDSSVPDDAWQHGVVLLPLAFLAILLAWHVLATTALLRSSERQPRFLVRIAMLAASTAFMLSLPSIIVCAWTGLGTPLQAFTIGLHACMALTASSVAGGALWWAIAKPVRQ